MEIIEGGTYQYEGQTVRAWSRKDYPSWNVFVGPEWFDISSEDGFDEVDQGIAHISELH